MYRILVIGAVSTTKHTLKQLIKNDFNVVGVLGHEPTLKGKVSGWVDLTALSNQYNLDYKGFKKINDSENIKWAEEKKPDIIFAVGFSQLMSEDWINMPRLGCIGFHPTHLPKGRGRAPLAWTVLEQVKGTATFFLMGKGADDGPIFVQEIFDIKNDDDATSVEKKIEEAINISLSNWLPVLKKGIWEPIEQDENEATWYGKRSADDGIIHWDNSAYYIDRLIKASTKPHPGAYTYFKDEKIIIWESSLEKEIPIKGVVGRVLLVDKDKGYLVQCGTGLIWLINCEIGNKIKLRVGDKLGYNIEDEIFNIKKLLKTISNE